MTKCLPCLRWPAYWPIRAVTNSPGSENVPRWEWMFAALQREAEDKVSKRGEACPDLVAISSPVGVNAAPGPVGSVLVAPLCPLPGLPPEQEPSSSSHLSCPECQRCSCPCYQSTDELIQLGFSKSRTFLSLIFPSGGIWQWRGNHLSKDTSTSGELQNFMKKWTIVEKKARCMNCKSFKT